MDNPRSHSPATSSPLSKTIAAKAERRLKSQRKGLRNVWFGLAMSGLIGWSIAAPMLAGVAVGIWLDRTHPGQHSWTLTLLVAGLLVGCWNAWRWVEQEDSSMHSEERQNDD